MYILNIFLNTLIKLYTDFFSFAQTVVTKAVGT